MEAMIRLSCGPDKDKPGRKKIIGLKPNEIDMVKDLAGGIKLIEMAERRKCSSTTLVNHLKRARDRVHVKTNEELVAYALRNGIIQ